MWHNREIQRVSIVLVVLIICFTVCGIRLHPWAGMVTLGSGICLSIVFFIFTAWRYQVIQNLSQKLEKICAGNYSLDIRDNQEGELSILKNDIYKVTIMLTEQGKQLEKDKKGLADALSDISHQLKTPLTSMMMMTELLSTDHLEPEKRKEFTKQIQMQLERIEWLVTSLLKLSKIDAGAIVFKQEQVAVAVLLKQVVSPFLIPMELKNQSLKVSGEEDTYFTGDFHWTYEALTNVLKNCIEHTPDGGQIKIWYGNNPIYTMICIQDNGLGIAKADLPYIFQRFYKGKNSNPDSVGIGLAMSKSIVQAQRGDITVKSFPGQGSCFTIKFYKQTV